MCSLKISMINIETPGLENIYNVEIMNRAGLVSFQFVALLK